MADLDRLLRSDISYAAEEVVQSPDFTTIERRGVRRRRTHTLLGVAAAAVVVLIGVGGSLRILGTGDAAAPHPAEQPPPRSMPTVDTAIEPGTYLVPPAAGLSEVNFTVTFPGGWEASDGGYQFSMNKDEPDELTILPFEVDQIFANACRGEGGRSTTVGQSVDDLVTALLEQPGGAVWTDPVTTTLGGYPATRIDLRIPKRLDLERCQLARYGSPGLQVWVTTPDTYFALPAGGVASVYVVHVHGQRQVFTAGYVSAHTSADDLAELQAVLDSIDIH